MIQNTILVILGVAVTVGVIWLYRVLSGYRREARLESARKQFCLRREWLEADFLNAASATGRPRGLAWVDCDFSNEVSFARDRKSGDLTALVGVAIQFEAIEGGGMEEVEAVGNQKAATAVFRHNGSCWSTDGRAIFNLNPLEAIEYYQSDLEMVD
ncbi:MAG: hypothetical protein P8N76_29040 [Pirellulaceae bacterium]|nr:hypothetical protein [Pirellulaceae bacterium]